MSEPASNTCPLSHNAVIDRYFLEHRQKVIDVAAFLDRIDRAAPADANGQADYRVSALLQALDVLRDGKSERARRVLELLSDPTAQTIDTAQGTHPATGAYKLNAD